YVWQNPYYGFVEPRVIDELSLILRLTGLKGDWSIVELLMGPELYYRNPFTLSGGEAKRVSIASVLIADQPVWLLDEPFDYLDGEGVRAVMKLINYGRQRNKVIIIATVNTGFISALRPNLVIIMRRGSIVYEAPYHELSEAVLNDNNVPPRDLLCG
ncbi:MAG: energy-coupling factor ABC transporter ATP-binding protein, partial [Desulfurococcaceae archaeon]